MLPLANLLLSARTLCYINPSANRVLRLAPSAHRAAPRMVHRDSNAGEPSWVPPAGFRNWEDEDTDPDATVTASSPATSDASTEATEKPAWTPPPGFRNWNDDQTPDSVIAASTTSAFADAEDPDAFDFLFDVMPDSQPQRRSSPMREEPPPLRAVVEMPSAFCSGCGVRFQSDEPTAPGYVPPSVLEARTKTADDLADEAVGRLKPTRSAVCQRCHGLRYQNRLPADTLRVGGDGDGSHKALSPSHFRDLLRSLRHRRCVIVCIVDLFDFHGSLAPDLPQIVGADSPLMMVANKLDLLPHGIQPAAIDRWVRSECRRANLPPLHSLDLISCKTGAGMPQLLARLEKLMRSRGCDAYVLGAANAGKSSFLNYCIKNSGQPRSKKRSAAASSDEDLTTSHLPGTTLDFVRTTVIGGRLALYDTPGIILPNQLTTLLTTEELAVVVPKKRSQHVTLRLSEGKSILLGGIARIHFRSGLPFLFTFYLASSISLHPTATSKVESVLEKHLGTLLEPPSSMERLKELGEFRDQTVEVLGRGWDEAAIDIVLPGLGWVAVTGSGSCKVDVSLPSPIRAVMREPLLPSESTKKTMVRFTGGKLSDKKGKTKRKRK